jgi:hypothetical protein
VETPAEHAIDLRRAWCLMPLISLLVVFGIGEIVKPASGIFEIPSAIEFAWTAECAAGAAGGSPVYLRSPAGSIAAFAADLSGRFRWAAAAAFAIGLGLMTLLASAFIVARQLGSVTRHPVRVTLIALGALVVTSTAAVTIDGADNLPPIIGFGCLLVALWGHATNRPVGAIASAILVSATAAWVLTELPLGAWLFDAPTTGRYQKFALTTTLFDNLQATLHTSRVGWPWFDRAVGGLSAVVVVTLAVAVCALAADCRRDLPLEDARLRERAESLRVLLYLGGGVLVGGVIFIKMLHDWPLSLLCDKQAVTLFGELATHWPVVVATYWSLMLIAIFVPAQISVARAARTLARAKLSERPEPASEKDVDAWLDERGLRTSPTKQITQFVALLSPWLTSVPFAALFDYAKQAFGG